MQRDQLAVIICEDPNIAIEIIGKYFSVTGCTHVEYLKKTARPLIIKALQELLKI